MAYKQSNNPFTKARRKKRTPIKNTDYNSDMYSDNALSSGQEEINSGVLTITDEKTGEQSDLKVSELIKGISKNNA